MANMSILKDISPEEPGYEYWKAYQLWKRAMHGCFFTMFLMAACLTLPHSKSFETLLGPLCMLSIVGGVVCNWVLLSWRCPACKRKFHGPWWRQKYMKDCDHCGLPKWSPPPLKVKTMNPSGVFTTCPYCHEEFGDSAQLVKCLWCGAAHHVECWNIDEHCSVYHCPGKATIRAGNHA